MVTYYPAKGERSFAGISSYWSSDHGTWVLSRFVYATSEREVFAVHPEPLRPGQRGTLQPWMNEALAGLKVGNYLTMTDVYGYTDHWSEYK